MTVTERRPAPSTGASATRALSWALALWGAFACGGGATDATPAVDVTGKWIGRMYQIDELRLTLAQSPDGAVTGTGTVDLGAGPLIRETASGRVRGTRVELSLFTEGRPDLEPTRIRGDVKGTRIDGAFEHAPGDWLVLTLRRE